MENLSSPIYQVALDVPLRRLFDYLPPLDAPLVPIARGMRVKVPFGRQEKIGIVLGHSLTSSFAFSQLKSIVSVCDSEALFPESLCLFIEKTARYYHHPIGEVAFTGAPLGIRQGKTAALANAAFCEAFTTHSELALTPYQQQAIDTILAQNNQFSAFLLHGVTGSGKTEVYLQIAAHMLNQQKQVLILVPEISLTPQTYARFVSRFKDVVCYHSRMTPSQRFKTWLKVRNQQTQIIVGTRSAIFLPFMDLGLIVIDEEHDPSFKQQEGFRYGARDVAVLRAKLMNCPIILGSATPAFESLYNVKAAKYQELNLPLRAAANLPQVKLLDVRHNKLAGGLCAQLLHTIETHLKANGQVLLFINRRGFSPTFMCFACGWLAQCKRCDARLTLHHRLNALICHHCLSQCAKPHSCPDCQAKELNPVGQGTERLEAILTERFPTIAIARLDSDATRKKGALEAVLTKAHNKEIQLLIGTQILAKGHHFPHLTLVAIVDADGGLFSVDFRAVEHMAQLIIQVAGRAGRAHQAGHVIIQTFHPTHPLLQYILQQDYRQLAENLLIERQACQLPPFSHLALIRAHAKDDPSPQRFLNEVHDLLKKQTSNVKILGPVPAPMLKRQGYYRYQLLLQAASRPALHQLLSYLTPLLESSKQGKRVRWSLDIDPVEMF